MDTSMPIAVIVTTSDGDAATLPLYHQYPHQHYISWLLLLLLPMIPECGKTSLDSSHLNGYMVASNKGGGGGKGKRSRNKIGGGMPAADTSYTINLSN
ncbi:hypothetical protein RDWZM_007496 [Blomia tropicalis]|uniref:Uncharacterized protein n=1 Tax=Blomia tropicalis TaxID=40697 RepID=A0A9Q0RJ32_BLOTA|nr:hypothetical protein RDWZM_007496 [Blomia tropicalis]